MGKLNDSLGQHLLIGSFKNIDSRFGGGLPWLERSGGPASNEERACSSPPSGDTCVRDELEGTQEALPGGAALAGWLKLKQTELRKQAFSWKSFYCSLSIDTFSIKKPPLRWSITFLSEQDVITGPATPSRAGHLLPRVAVEKTTASLWPCGPWALGPGSGCHLSFWRTPSYFFSVLPYLGFFGAGDHIFASCHH